MRNYQRGVERLCAACDEELLGEKYSEGRFRLDVSPGFYDGQRVEREALQRYLGMATIANLVGKRCVDLAVELGLVDADNVLRVEGVPHAQFAVLEP